MTDSRLPGRWLTDIKFQTLSDRAWRTWCGALLWSNEQGTDGAIPSLAMKYLHPNGVDDATRLELIEAKLWRHTKAGIQVVDWAGSTGQSAAADIAAQRENNRMRQRKHRQKVTRDVTRDVTGESLGQDRTGEDRTGQDYGEAQINQGTGEVVGWPVAEIPDSPSDWGSADAPGAFVGR